MKTNGLNLPDDVREYFTSRGYRQLQVEYPDFGGIIIYLPGEGIGQEAAYYISKPSTIELVTSDELRRVLDLLEGSGIPLRHAIATSPFSAGSRKLAAENGISLAPLQSQYAETAQSFDNSRAERRPLRPGMSLE